MFWTVSGQRRPGSSTLWIVNRMLTIIDVKLAECMESIGVEHGMYLDSKASMVSKKKLWFVV